jgi:hypothetical protein
MTMAPHKRQFVISNKQFSLGDDWRILDLPDGFSLSYQRDLAFKHCEGAAIVLGDEYAGAGRFVRLIWPLIKPGPSTLLSVYFSMSDKGPIVSSSPALLAQLTGHSRSMTRQMRWGGLNWVPGPGAPLDGARKLLANQTLHLPSLVTKFESESFPRFGSFGEATAVAAQELVEVVRQSAKGADTVFLALTAGLDSRTIASALMAGGLPFETMTQRVQSETDIVVARNISRYFGIRHHLIEPSEPVAGQLEAWRCHTLASYCDADDQLLVPREQYRFLGAKDLLIRGGCFEIGRRYYSYSLENLTFENASGDLIWQRLEGGPADSTTVAFLNEWLAFRRSYPSDLDLIDAFYNDQRLAGWLAAIEQGLDALPGRSFHPANSRRIIGALLTPSHVERKSGALQRNVIRTLEPKLLRFPINPIGLVGQVRAAQHKARRLLSTLVRLPFNLLSPNARAGHRP